MKRFSLAEAMRNGLPEPEMLAGGSLYRGAVHLLAGPPEAGKTTLALSWALDVIRNGGVVMFLDEEGGPRIVTDRCHSLGYTADEIDQIAYFPFPSRTKEGWTKEGWRDLLDDLGEVKPDMILIDSVARIMGAAGLDENSNTDANMLWDTFTKLARGKLKPAIVVIDHVAKNAEDSGYSRGASSKKAASDVTYLLTAATPFNRQQDGIVKLLVTKDREGYLTRNRRLDVLRAPLRFADQDVQPVFRPTHVMKLCAEALARHEQDGGSPVGKNWFNENVTGRKQTILQAVNAMIEDGLLESAGAVRGNPSYRLRRSFEPENSPERFPVPSGSQRFPEPVPGSHPLRGEPVEPPRNGSSGSRPSEDELARLLTFEMED